MADIYIETDSLDDFREGGRPVGEAWLLWQASVAWVSRNHRLHFTIDDVIHMQGTHRLSRRKARSLAALIVERDYWRGDPRAGWSLVANGMWRLTAPDENNL